ncbi:Polyribonucleotide nucleotidyltransferase [Fimbriiglobus ruber]|uniref:Polyribonucleotide nucleotidyltransferase n=1 Tax=Fimbriiglobus ruber TaxID=1908690 RepID=A0A225D941_9BACT|nr:Polyribonucleotide nucleotidyltransferase [Fimbriiglobus ruber]
MDDSKAGKTGKCPKCQSQFVIPMPEGDAAPASAPPPPPPAPNPSEPVEIAPCPKCQARLSVAASDLGVDVECPYCKSVYKAVRPGSGPAPVPPPKAPDRRRDEDDEDRPQGRRKRRDDDEEEDRPKSKRRRDEDDEDDERPSRKRREDDEDDRPSRKGQDDDADDERPSRKRREDDEDDDRPRKKKRRRGGNYEPHRGVLILVLGILSFVLCGIFTAIPAWIMGKADLQKMDEGIMDPEGRSMTNIGKILGMISCILTLVVMGFYCVIFVIALAAGGGGR